MEDNKKNEEKIQINIDNTDSAIGWLERILVLLKDYGTWKILGATLLIAVVSILLYFMLNFNKVFELYDAWKIRQHDKKIELRMEMGPKIQSLIDKLTYSSFATRTVVLELHNGITGSGGLPFTKCTATYESLNIGKRPISDQYQEVNMSLMPFANKLFQEGYWCGNTDELEHIDRGLYHKMKANNTEHFAACMIEGIDNKPIAFMIVSFEDCPNNLAHHDCNITRENIRHVAMELAVILEVTKIINDTKN